MENVIAFFTSVSLMEILLIFVSKVVEVTISTVRTILMNKGYRVLSTILSFFEILLWVFVASVVINGIQDKPLKGIIYALGFTSGIFLGSFVESKLAFGQVGLQVIIDKVDETELVEHLRSKNLAVTHYDAKGKNSDKAILLLSINRKGKEKVIQDIQNLNPKAVVFGNDISTLKGGYITQISKRL